MPIHDAYARLTPYELLLPDPGFADDRFPAIGAEADQLGVDAGNPAAFVMLGAVQGVLADLREEEADPASAHDHAGVLYFAYQMWRTQGTVVLVRVGTLRSLLHTPQAAPGRRGDGGDARADHRWLADLRGRAGYFQLPQHLVWLEEGDADGSAPPPESVDGVFWFADGGGVLHLTMIAGMREDRPGYVAVAVPPQPVQSLPEWATGPAREGDADFSTSLPGAELDGLVGIRTPAEVFKLVALLLARAARVRPQPCPPHPAAPAPPPRPSALPFAAL